MRKLKVLCLVLLISILTVSCTQVENGYDAQGFAMGTVITQHIFSANAEKITGKVLDKIKQLEKIMTINAPGSEVDFLNASAGNGKWVKLDPEIIYVMKKALDFGARSNGAFDITVGPLVKAWGIFTDHPKIPSPAALVQLKKLINYKDLSIDESTSSARLRLKGQIVDLGGIAKGYAGDVAKEIYLKNGVTSAYISLGGNIVALGSKPDGTPWNVGIQNPRLPNGKYLAVIPVQNKSVVTSGDYERFFMKNNIRYHHILDTKTGYPSDSGLISTSIISDLSIDGDALSTSTFVLGLEKGMALIESLPGVEAIFITKDKKIYVTSGLKDIITFTDDGKEFTYVEKR
ncbi:MAG: FAD:protein FMN transferase [Clostridia bacterium]